MGSLHARSCYLAEHSDLLSSKKLMRFKCPPAFNRWLLHKQAEAFIKSFGLPPPLREEALTHRRLVRFAPMIGLVFPVLKFTQAFARLSTTTTSKALCFSMRLNRLA